MMLQLCPYLSQLLRSSRVTTKITILVAYQWKQTQCASEPYKMWSTHFNFLSHGFDPLSNSHWECNLRKILPEQAKGLPNLASCTPVTNQSTWRTFFPASCPSDTGMQKHIAPKPLVLSHQQNMNLSNGLPRQQPSHLVFTTPWNKRCLRDPQVFKTGWSPCKTLVLQRGKINIQVLLGSILNLFAKERVLVTKNWSSFRATRSCMSHIQHSKTDVPKTAGNTLTHVNPSAFWQMPTISIFWNSMYASPPETNAFLL